MTDGADHAATREEAVNDRARQMATAAAPTRTPQPPSTPSLTAPGMAAHMTTEGSPNR